MKRIEILFFLIFLIGISMISCVSGRKFKDVQDKSRHFMDERDNFKASNILLEMTNRELESEAAGLRERIDKADTEIEKVRKERDNAVDEVARISSQYQDLQNAHEELIKGNVKETQKLLTELQAAHSDLQQKEDILRQLEANLDSKKASLDELNFELQKRNERLVELEKILDTQKKIAQDLKNKVSDALLGFENNGLTVTQKDGKVYVSLDEELLFKTASWDIDDNGRNALKKLAGVLERNPNIMVTIEGHTDNVPYNPGNSQLRDNWDLSVKRATTVVRVLLEGSRINPMRLIASGRSEYVPVDDRDSADARQKNRRTEIILTPDLSELYELINRY